MNPTSIHRYIPNAEQDVREMLATIGVGSVEALFETIPADVRLTDASELDELMTAEEYDEYCEKESAH